MTASPRLDQLQLTQRRGSIKNLSNRGNPLGPTGMMRSMRVMFAGQPSRASSAGRGTPAGSAAEGRRGLITASPASFAGASQPLFCRPDRRGW